MDRDEMSNLYRRPAIDASYQVLLHLAEGFQRRRLKCEKLTDDGRQVMVGLSLTLDPIGKMFQNASSLKPLGQLKPNSPGMIIGRSSTNSLFFMPIGNPSSL